MAFNLVRLKLSFHKALSLLIFPTDTLLIPNSIHSYLILLQSVHICMRKDCVMKI